MRGLYTATYVVDPNPAIEEYKQRVKKIMKDKEKSERMDMGEEDTRGKELKAKAKVKAKEDEAKERKTMGEEDKLSKEAEKERKRLKKAENERRRALKAAKAAKAEAKAAKAAKKTGSGYKQEIKSLRQNLVLQLIRPTNRMVEHSNMNTREF
jgi:colicin import membrane protein